MSLLRRNKDKQLAAEKKLAARHAIVKMGVDRDVRDVYFHGLVFAAVANDDHIDESERARLLELGEALELTAEDVAEAMRCLTDMEDDAKMDVIEECARQLTNVEVAECFLKEFEEIWLLGGGNKDEFSEFRSQLVDWMGEDVCAVETAKEKAAAESEAKREAEEARVKAEQARRIEKEKQRAKDGFRTFGEDALRVVKELSFYDKVRVSCDDLGMLRDRLLGEGYGAVDFERTLTVINAACVDVVPKAGTLRIKRYSNGSIKSVSIECNGWSSKQVLKDKDIRLCLRKDAVWKLIGLATVKRTLSERTVKFLNGLLDIAQGSEPHDLCLDYFWAYAVEWWYLRLFQDENTIEKERGKREKENSFFDTVTKVVEDLGFGGLTSISYAEANTFIERLVHVGYQELEAQDVYQAVYESFVAKDESIEKDYWSESRELEKRAKCEGKRNCSLLGISDEEHNCWKKREERREKLYLQMCWAVLGLGAVVGRISSEDVSKFNGLIRKARGEAKSVIAGNANSRTVFWSLEVEKRVEKIFGLKPVWEDGEE